MKLPVLGALIAAMLPLAMSQDDNLHLRIGAPSGVVLNLTASGMQRDLSAPPLSCD